MAEQQQNATTQEQAQKQKADEPVAQEIKRVEQSKVYAPLASIPKAQIERCSYLLPNDLQCWRAADYLVTVKTVTPATDTSTEAKTTESSYQLCARHAVIEQAVAAGRMKPEEKTAVEGSQFQQAPNGPAAQSEVRQLKHNEDGPKIPVGSTPPPEAEKATPVAIPAVEAKNPPAAIKPVPTDQTKGTSTQTQTPPKQ